MIAIFRKSSLTLTPDETSLSATDAREMVLEIFLNENKCETKRVEGAVNCTDSPNKENRTKQNSILLNQKQEIYKSV